LALSLQFNVDYDLADANENWQGRLVFEPYRMVPPPTILTGAWQEWDPRAGYWWATGAPGNGFCSMAAPCSWDFVRNKWPRAGVQNNPMYAGMGFKAGSSWAGGFQGKVVSVKWWKSLNAASGA
jgi:hypothetical protein